MKTRNATPLPGRPLRSSRTGRPIMAALELLSRKWLLRVLWELRCDALSFRALQQACGQVSPTVLNSRLKDLRAAGLLVDRSREGYALSPLGRDLLASLKSLNHWSARWARALTSEGGSK